jgi:hypothetical protein
MMSQTATLPLARASRRLHLRQLALVPKPAPSAYYSTNRERIIAQGRAYYQAHRTEILARLAASYARTPGKYIRRVRLSQARRRAKLVA